MQICIYTYINHIHPHIRRHISLWLLCLHALTGKEELLCHAAPSKHVSNSEATEWSGCIMRAGMVVRRARSGWPRGLLAFIDGSIWKLLLAAICLFRKGTQLELSKQKPPRRFVSKLKGLETRLTLSF